MTDGKLFSGQSLLPEQTLVSVGDHAHLHYQGDGNLVVYLDGNPIWASHTDGQPAGMLKMRADGDMVVQTPDGSGIAHSKTAGHPGAMVQLQDDGNFVIYEDPRGPLAGTPIWASASSQFVHEHVDKEPVPDRPTTRLVGKVELVDGGRGGVRDASGQRLIIGLHTGSLLSTAKNIGWSGPLAAIDYADRTGFHFIRDWTNLPAPDWWGTAPRPGTFSAVDPEHWPTIDRFTDELLARGLRWLVSQGDLLWFHTIARSWSRQQLFDYMAQLGQRLQAKGGTDQLVIGVDAGNEAWNFTRCTDTDLMGAMLDAFLRECPCPIRSMTSAADEGELNTLIGPPVTVTDKHGSRGEFRHAMERSFTVSYWDGKVHPYTIDSEGPGCGPKVSAVNDYAQWMEPEVMGAITLMQLITHQMPVVMSSPGVYLSNETFDAYDAQLSLGPRMIPLLPPDIQSWREFHGGDDKSFSPDRILRAPAKPGNYRCEHKQGPDGQYGVFVYQDAPGPLAIEAINGFEGTIMDPGTLQIEPISFNKGQIVNFNFRRARFLLGHRK